MPLRARIKDLLSVKKNKRKASRESGTSKSGTATPHTPDENATPVHAEETAETQLADSIPVDQPVVKEPTVVKPDNVQPKALSLQDTHDAADGGTSKTLMAIDAAIEVTLIVKEASEASSVLIPLKVSSAVILKILEAARVSGHFPDPSRDLNICPISGEVDY